MIVPNDLPAPAPDTPAARELAVDELLRNFQSACERALVNGDEAHRSATAKHRAILRNELRQLLLRVPVEVEATSETGASPLSADERRLDDYERLIRSDMELDHTFGYHALPLLKIARDHLARAVRCEGERDAMRVALLEIRDKSEHDSAGFRRATLRSIHHIARAFGGANGRD